MPAPLDYNRGPSETEREMARRQPVARRDKAIRSVVALLILLLSALILLLWWFPHYLNFMTQYTR